MAEMHPFLYDKEAKGFLPPDVRNRIKRERSGVGECYRDSHLRMLDVRGKVQHLMREGYFSSSSMPPGFKEKVTSMKEEPHVHAWTMDAGQESLYQDDYLLLGGIVAAEVIPSADFWKVPSGFNGPSDYHGTVGAMLLQKRREIFWNPEGYTWETTNGSETYISRITGDNNGDFRMERIRVDQRNTIDPFGTRVHYQPFAERDRQLVAPSYGSEPTILAAVLKYIDQENIDVPCLKNKCEGIRDILAGQTQEVGNCADFGQFEGQGRAKIILSHFAHPMLKLHDDRAIHWPLGCHIGQGDYHIHIDDQRRLTFTLESAVPAESAIPECQSLTLLPRDMENVVLGLFNQAQQGRGRTSVAQLVEILEYRFSEEFDDEMKRLKSMFGYEK